MSDNRQQRRTGHSRLIWDKDMQTIVTEHALPTREAGLQIVAIENVVTTPVSPKLMNLTLVLNREVPACTGYAVFALPHDGIEELSISPGDKTRVGSSTKRFTTTFAKDTAELEKTLPLNVTLHLSVPTVFN
jgi:hypothetical protein